MSEIEKISSLDEYVEKYFPHVDDNSADSDQRNYGYIKYGYIRVSTKDQNLERQLKKLLSFNISPENIFQEKESGRSMKRPVYQKLRSLIAEGDILYIDSFSRLGRNWIELVEEYNYLVHTKKVTLISLSDNEKFLNSNTYKNMGEMGEFVEHLIIAILSYSADIQRKQMLEAQREGIKIARQKGTRFGRPKIDEKKKKLIIDLYTARQYTQSQISEMFDIPLSVIAAITADFNDNMTFDDISSKYNLPMENIVLLINAILEPKYTIKEISKMVEVSVTTINNYTKGINRYQIL